MPTTSPNIQSSLTQALTQLAKLAPSSEAAKQGIEVIVRHLTGNQLQLTPIASNAHRSITLPQTPLIQKLTDGKTYTAKLSINSGSTPSVTQAVPPQLNLDFFTPDGPKSQQSIALSDQQVNQLLQLAPKQLLASLNAQRNTPLTIQGLVSQAPISKQDTVVLSQAKPNLNAPSNSSNSPPSPPRAASLTLNVPDSRPPVVLPIPLQVSHKLHHGEKLNLSLQVKGNNWHLVEKNEINYKANLKPRHQGNADQGKEAKQVISAPHAKHLSPNKPIVRAVQLPIAPELAVLLVKHIATQHANTENPELTLPVKALITALDKPVAKQRSAELKPLLALLDKSSHSQLSIKFETNNTQKLIISTDRPIATLPVTTELEPLLAPLKLPQQPKLEQWLKAQNPPLANPTVTDDKNTVKPNNTISTHKEFSLKSTIGQGLLAALDNLGQKISNSVKTSSEAGLLSQALDNKSRHIQNEPGSSKPTSRESSKAHSDSKPITQLPAQQTDKGVDKPLSKPDGQIATTITPAKLSSTPPVPPLDTGKPLTNEQKLTSLAQQLFNKVSDASPANSVIDKSFLDNKPQQSQLIQQLVRTVQAKVEPPATTLATIEKTLTDKTAFGANSDTELKQQVDQILQQIKAAIPQGKDQDNQNIRQLIMTPAMALPASQLNTGQAPQGMISGLVTLLQLSLSARLTRGQQTRAESIAKVVNSILPAVGKAPAKVSAKGLTEFSQLEQKNQLLKEIGRLLASHQASKLSNAEQLLQGQESFYYNIPTMLGGAFKQAELLIKREEQQQQDNSQQHTQGHTWQLTMKFSVGDMGELLSKAKLRPDSLDVNFYASNDTVKHLVMNYLPLLKRRLASLGIEISKSHCQLGKIPESLQQRPYHVFQTKV